jgi:hypothetical protein
MTPVSEAAVEALLHSFTDSAFRLEAQSSYAVTDERAALERFAAGDPRPPDEYPWWQEWINLVAEHATLGRTVQRVRVLAEPLSTYQRWLLWGDRWHVDAGEQIFYLSRDEATAIGLPLDADWWLFDGEQVAVMRFAPGGAVAGIDLVTGEDAVRPYRAWRDLALTRATAATSSTA